ncbi:MAG TPA: Arm DNA-binding domain-containing protein [Gemmatimonadota bacterium]|nr:Arm DNA-binding domain-containing protein [Gemmatimonadota bacterium]
MKVRLTDKRLRSLAAPKGKYGEYWDTTFTMTGASFGVRVSGSKQFMMIYRRDDTEKRMTLGEYPAMKLGEARDKAEGIASSVRVNHADPAAERKAERAAPTFEAVAERFLLTAALTPAVDLDTKPRSFRSGSLNKNGCRPVTSSASIHRLDY